MQHPNVVAFCEVFVEAKFVCMVTEYCEGGDLAARIGTQSELGVPFAHEQVMDWFVEISLALQYIHELRILHRDLKTNNIFLRKGMVKLGTLTSLSQVL